MASIKKIEGKNGVSYKITVSCGYDVKGKKIIETATFKPDAGLTPKKMEKAAQDFAHEFESRVKSGAAMDLSLIHILVVRFILQERFSL